MGGIPVTLVPAGSPITATVGGTPVTLVNADGTPEPLVPPGAAVVTDGTATNTFSTDGSTTLSQATTSVIASNFAGVRLPGGTAVLLNGQSSVNVEQFDNSGSAAASVHVVNNTLQLVLANAVSRIGFNAVPVQVVAGSKTVGATIAIDQGAYQPFPLSATTDAIVSNAEALLVPVTGTYTNTITPTVVNGNITGFVLS